MLLKTLAIAALPAGLAFCSTATSPDTSSEDQFSAEALSNYSAYSDGTTNPWTVVPGTLQGNGIGQQSVLVRKADIMSNGWIEITADSIDDGGIVAHFSDNEHYWLLAVRDDQAPYPRSVDNLQLYRRGGAGQSGFVSEWRTDVFWPRGTQHRVRLEMMGDTLRVHFDGAVIGQVIESAMPLSGTGFGVRHYGATASWISRYRILRWKRSK